jgi:hypothetical protein
MSEQDFEFDIAFSFHSLDEGLATELNDLLQDRFRTFLYSKRQEMLAGSDGEERFNSVYGGRARCVVVFCRKEWGETPFTRIEQTAIKNRAYNEGYDFTLFIPTDAPPTVPRWLPKTRLWFGLERFGLKGLAAVVEARIQELGGEPRIESVADRAARLQRQIDFKTAKERFRSTETGVKEAVAAFSKLVEALQTRTASVTASSRLTGLQIRKIGDIWAISGLGPWVTIHWWQRYTNSLSDSPLRVDFFDSVPRMPGTFPAVEEGTRIKSLIFEYHLVGPDRHGYVESADGDRSYSGEELADHLLRLYFDVAERFKPRY